MFDIYRSDWYQKKLDALERVERDRVMVFEQHLKNEPFSGKPLSYKFIREKKFNGNRLIFLIYEELKSILLVTITDKKRQKEDIHFIKAHLSEYKVAIEDAIRKSKFS